MAAETDLRPVSSIMRLSRLGSFHQCRLSFMRQLTRRMAGEGWQFSRPVFTFNGRGEGTAVYCANTGERTYSLVAFGHDLPPEKRSDRVIAEAWDATFTLYDGVPTEDDIERLRANVPKQEAGRVSERELSLSRANRSVRLWQYVVGALAAGRQPEEGELVKVGYLMRTTAVYGSGKFGAADREVIADRREMQSPFQAEMLSVYLTRTFVRDLVEWVAQQQGGERALRLNEKNARCLGIGNSTGLGMAPFLVNHPRLLNNWIEAREKAIARVCALDKAQPDEIAAFMDWLERAARDLEHWHTAHPLQMQKLKGLRQDVIALKETLNCEFLSAKNPWLKAMHWAQVSVGEEAQEWLASLMLEPYANLVDPLATSMADNAKPAVFQGAMLVGEVIRLLRARFDWAEAIDWESKEATARIWYTSEEKLEPRLGERYEEPLADYEQPLCPAQDAACVLKLLDYWPHETPIADFVCEHPQYRRIIKRIQNNYDAPYAEIRDNLLSAQLMPIDMLRAKLSFFGATHFDPRSDRWLRICMYQGAPYPEQLSQENADYWVYARGAV